MADDLDLVTIYEDAGISGKRADNRPGLADAIEHVQRVNGVLVVYSMSRLSRSTVDMLELTRRLEAGGAQFVSCKEKIDTTTAAGKMFFRIMAVLNEFERDVIAERTKDALSRKRRDGEALGNVPYGYRRDGALLAVEPSERRVLDVVLRAKLRGRSNAAISRALNAAGLRTRKGTPWERGSLRRICRYYLEGEGRALLERVQPDPEGDRPETVDSAHRHDPPRRVMVWTNAGPGGTLS